MDTKITKGFTLIEIILYFGLFSILMLVLVEIFTTTLAVKVESESASAVAQDASFILSRVGYDLTNASAATVPGSQTLQFNRNAVNYSYSLDDENLVLNQDGGAGIKLNGRDSAVTSLSFQKVGNPSGKPTIQIIFTIAPTAVGPNAEPPQTFQTTVGLR